MIANLKPYPKMKDSGLPWLGNLPAHWNLERAKWLFKKMARPSRDADEVVTCFRDGTVTLRKNRRVRGFTESLQEIGYQGIRRGDLVIHAMDAFAGAIGVADSDGKGTPVYSVCKPVDRANSHYYAYLLREMSRAQWIQALAKGIRERSTDFRFEDFGSQLVAVPPFEEQAAIVRFLDNVERPIRRYVRAKQALIKLLHERQDVLTQVAVNDPITKSVRLKRLVVQALRYVNRSDDLLYRPIGMFNRGRGIFHKSATRGRDLGASSFHWIHAGDLVFSGQFAWEGAVSIAQVQDHGCIASHRYYIFTPQSDEVKAEYLQSFFMSSMGELLLNHHSRGAAGRNRPLNTRALLQERVPLPTVDHQTRIKKVARQKGAVTAHVKMETDLILEFRTQLFSDVVTGKLDVREVTWQLESEGHLESEEEAGIDLLGELAVNAVDEMPES